jgi:hypothetical protein
MMRSIVLAGLLVAALAACAQKPAEPPAAVDNAANSVPTLLVPYCGPIWNVDKQGYEDIPCPAGSGYVSGR